MNRRGNSIGRGIIVSLVVFGIVLATATMLLNRIDRSSAEAEEQLVRDAVKRAAVTCYATEGAYPESLDYLKAQYGLIYNEEEFFISYNAFASNLMPDIQVTRKGAGA